MQRIPSTFVEENGYIIEEGICLIDPIGGIWNIPLDSINGQFCLGNEWRQFVKSQNLQPRSLLLFKCLGISNMKIRVFDESATEIKYGTFQQTLPPVTDENSALSRANMYTTNNPSFVVSIQPSHLTPKGGANIPVSFTRLHLNEVPEYVTLETTANGFMAWKIRCSHTHGKNYLNRRLCWPVFVQHSKIRCGDVCVIEILSSDEVRFRATVFRK